MGKARPKMVGLGMEVCDVQTVETFDLLGLRLWFVTNVLGRTVEQTSSRKDPPF